MNIEGYVRCANAHCGKQVIQTTAWQTRGVCFECFREGQMPRLLEVEINQRANMHRIQRHKNGKPPKRGPDWSKVNLARLRALRRLGWLFPDVFDVLYADERDKAGLEPRIHVDRDRLSKAVETYTAFAAYHAAQSGVDDEAT